MKTAVVLDYDETLGHTKEEVESIQAIELLKENNNLTPVIRSRLYVIDIYDNNNRLSQRMWGVKRPHLELFLRFCFAAFDYVILWSAGTHLYVDRAVKITFRDAGLPDPHYVFSREDCFATDDGDHIKPLQRLHILEPSLAKEVPVSNMVIVDNKESNFADNPENALLIDDYCPKPTLEDLMQDEKSLLIAILLLARRRFAMGPLISSKLRIVNECLNRAQMLIGDV